MTLLNVMLIITGIVVWGGFVLPWLVSGTTTMVLAGVCGTLLLVYVGFTSMLNYLNAE